MESETSIESGISPSDVLIWLEQPITRHILAQIAHDRQASEADAIALMAKGNPDLYAKAMTCAVYAEALSKVYWYANTGLLEELQAELKRKEEQNDPDPEI